MSSKQQSDELFEMIGNDPSLWLEQARWLKASAQVMQTDFNRVRGLNLPQQERSDALLGLMHSLLLLTSFSFENLIKGIIATRHPGQMIVKGRLNTSLWIGNGHRLVQMIPVDITLTAEESELLTRLEVYALWGGRYPVAIKADDFHIERDKLNYKPTDPALIDQLFARLSKYVGV